jgi:hypothetical protein
MDTGFPNVPVDNIVMTDVHLPNATVVLVNVPASGQPRERAPNIITQLSPHFETEANIEDVPKNAATSADLPCRSCWNVVSLTLVCQNCPILLKGGRLYMTQRLLKRIHFSLEGTQYKSELVYCTPSLQ